MNNTADYETFLDNLILDFRTQALSGKPHTIYVVVDLLTPEYDNSRVQAVCAELKIATKAEFYQEINRKRQRSLLGTAPANATELVEAFVKTYDVTARYDGTIQRKVQAMHIDSKGVERPITKKDREDRFTDLYASIVCESRSKFNRLDIERELRTLSTNYRMNISRYDISDAVDEWIKEAQRARLFEIFLCIDKSESYNDRWTEMAQAVFDCSDTSPDYVAAVLKKFVWQVKRKIRDLPVTDHLMPVILGPQGIGKSTLVNQILSPVDELKLNVHFNMLTDDRNVEIWSSYVMFLDEMGYASKADIDTVKNVITASSLTRRPMATNSKTTITQNATFIGCSNKELSQLVRDPTGNRRFAAIRMRSDADRDLINSINWAAMWGRVDSEAADPMACFRDMLAAQQDVTRERSRVEQWMDDFDGTCNVYQSALIGKTGNVSAMNLYLCFQAYENAYYPSGYKTSKTDWDHEMTRLWKNAPDSMIFTKKRVASGNSYRWKNETSEGALRLV